MSTPHVFASVVSMPGLFFICSYVRYVELVLVTVGYIEELCIT